KKRNPIIVYSLVFSSQARKEFLEAYYWYKDQSPGLGKRFEQVMDRQLQIIRKRPFLFQERKLDYRECVVPVFTFIIIYKLFPKENEILILSVFHTSRSPDNKYKK